MGDILKARHGLAYAHRRASYDGTAFWPWMRFPGDAVFALGALLMAWDFIAKSWPLLPRFALRLLPGGPARPTGVSWVSQ